MPAPSATITSPASRAARASTPVPMKGASGTSSGTACFCMLAPMRARLASSCSTKGMSAVETETICLGETSIRSTSAGGTKSTSLVVPYEVVVGADAHAGALRAAPDEHALVGEVARCGRASPWPGR